MVLYVTRHGETLRQACDRIDGGLNQIRCDYKDKTILLICHGFVSRAVHRYCNNLTFEKMAGFTLKNCEFVKYILET